jgi:hypothetical protein
MSAIPRIEVGEKQLRSVRRASAPSEKTGTHHRCADGEEAEGDEEVTCVVAIAVGSSATAVVVDGSSARGPAAAFRLRLDLFGRANDSLRAGVIGITARDVW